MNIEIDDYFIIVSFHGEIDSSHVGSYRKQLDDLIENSHKDMIFDFSDTTMIDSSGIGLVLGRYNQLKNDQRILMITGLNSVTYRLFELTGLFKIMPYFKSMEDIKEGKL
ncbi:MAG: STAS domain-containing protein [Erysipelotrichaceae bacterium]|nr:STAS domain-containing protein [Erysipelotrichaceae bacterium]